MNKVLVLVLLLVILVGVTVALFISPFLKQKELDRELHSKMLIGLSDFKGHYSLLQYRPRTIDEIGDYSKELGWKGGYHALYKKTGYIFPVEEAVFLMQDNSIYPIENISKTMVYFRDHPSYTTIGLDGETWNLSIIKTPEEIKSVGDDIVAYEGSAIFNGKPLHSFSAYFIKGDVFQAATLSGDEKVVSIDELIDYVKIINNLTS